MTKLLKEEDKEPMLSMPLTQYYKLDKEKKSKKIKKKEIFQTNENVFLSDTANKTKYSQYSNPYNNQEENHFENIDNANLTFPQRQTPTLNHSVKRKLLRKR